MRYYYRDDEKYTMGWDGRIVCLVAGVVVVVVVVLVEIRYKPNSFKYIVPNE